MEAPFRLTYQNDTVAVRQIIFGVMRQASVVTLYSVPIWFDTRFLIRWLRAWAGARHSTDLVAETVGTRRPKESCFPKLVLLVPTAWGLCMGRFADFPHVISIRQWSSESAQCIAAIVANKRLKTWTCWKRANACLLTAALPSVYPTRILDSIYYELKISEGPSESIDHPLRQYTG